MNIELRMSGGILIKSSDWSRGTVPPDAPRREAVATKPNTGLKNNIEGKPDRLSGSYTCDNIF